MANDNESYQESKSGNRGVVIKIVEIIITIVALSLLVTPLDSLQSTCPKRRIDSEDVAMIYIALGGYLMINALFIIAHLLGDRVPKRTLIIFAATGAIFHIVAASLIIHNWRKTDRYYYRDFNDETYGSKLYRDMMISSGIITFISAAVFAGEVFVTIRYS